jgi:hypothetical protein
MVMRAEIEEMKQTKTAQGQQANLMKKLTDRVSSKIKVARKVKQAGKYKGKFYQEDPEWLDKNIQPNPLTKVMQHQNTAWHWCSPATGGKCEGCWKVHKPSECRGTAPIAPQRATTVNAGGEEQQLCMMQALTSVLMENDEENQDNESMEGSHA